MKIRKKFADGEAVWQRIWFDEQIKEAGVKARIEMGIRPLGLINKREYSEWLTKNKKKIDKGFDNFAKPFYTFASFAMSRLPFEEHLSKYHIQALLWKYLLYNDVSFEFEEKYSPFEAFLLNSGKKYFYKDEGPGELLDGIYLRIPTTASIPAIINYVREHSKNIKWMQENSLIKTTSSKRLKIRKNFYRDIWIEMYMELPKSFFEKSLNRKFDYKEEGLSAFLEFVGRGKYAAETIKKAYARSKSLRKKLSK